MFAFDDDVWLLKWKYLEKRAKKFEENQEK